MSNNQNNKPRKAQLKSPSGQHRAHHSSSNSSNRSRGGKMGRNSRRSNVHHSKSGKGRSQHSKKMTFVNKPPEQLGPYKITKEIGKGAFGRVYKCIDKRTLKVFAIKTITTRNMNAQQKKDVQSEVELLASLPPHENIVRYIETVQDSTFFCIVLEYVDLGSLQSFIRQFGTEVTEQNVASFIIQILSGLHFLHEQGIIHRDIKAANVLITNDGVAKLADFGVAIKNKGDGAGNNNIMDEEVAGSPYWMAPEIIEMRGQLTPACDIWAVGATAIELFTGHPPYHNLQAMSALFRIVQDPHPEIPAKASNLFKEFLYQTFCKDPSRRPSANDLQSHKWLINMMQDNNSMYPDATEAVNPANAKEEEKNDDTDSEHSLSAGIAQVTQELIDNTITLGKKKLTQELARIKEEENAKKKEKKIKINEDEEQTFDESTITSISVGNGQNTLTAPDGSIVPIYTTPPSIYTTPPSSSSLAVKSGNKMKTKTPKVKAKKPKKVEEDEDSAWDSDSSGNETSGDSGDSTETDSDDSSSDTDSDSDSDDSDSEGFADLEVNANDFASRFDAQEHDEESEESDGSEWVDEEEEMASHNAFGGNQNQLDAIHQILKKLDENITHLQHYETTTDGIDRQREEAMVSELTKLNNIFEKSSQLIGQCIKTAIIPIMEMLSIPSEDVKCTALKTMDIIISDPKDGPQHLQTLCLVQLIPAIGNMVRVRSIRIKNAAAPFLKKFCEDSDGSSSKKKGKNKNFVRQMFIACGGIGILVDCLRNKYCLDNKKIIFVAVDCIHSIFESKMHNRRDLGRLFTKSKLLKRLLKRLHDSFGDVDDIKSAIIYGEKMAEIFFRIAELTDRVVKTNISGPSWQVNMASNINGMAITNGHGGNSNIFENIIAMPNILPNMGLPNIGNMNMNMNMKTVANAKQTQKKGESSILAQLLGLLPALEDDAKNGGKRKTILLRILKSFAELSKDSNCIGPLIEAATMSTVVPFLKSPDQDIQTCVVMILWNMTRVNNAHSTQARREAAENGAIPVLKRLILNVAHKSMYFLVQTICKFPNDADKETLFEMKKHNMCQFYIDMTKSGHGLSLDALSALARWIENEEYVPRLEFVLCQPDNITQLIELFANPIKRSKNKSSRSRSQNNKKNVNFNKSKNVSSILDAFKSLIFRSKRIADKLGDSNVFLQALGQWFQNDHLPQEIVNGLLQMLTKMFEYLEPSSKKKCAKTILPIIDKVFQMGQRRKKAVVVHLISKELIPHISLHVDQADIDDLSPELKKLLDPSH